MLFEQKLRALFAGEYYPNALHRFLAAIPGAMRADDVPDHSPVHHHDELRRCARAGVRGRRRGRRRRPVRGHADEPGAFVHVRPDGERVPIPEAHGLPRLRARRADRDPEDPRRRRPRRRDDDSYVITEDHYIDYLDAGRTSASSSPPTHGEDADEPLPLPRLRHARLEPSRDPAPDLGGAEAGFASWAIQLAPERSTAASGTERRGASSTLRWRSGSTRCAPSSGERRLVRVRGRRAPLPVPGSRALRRGGCGVVLRPAPSGRRSSSTTSAPTASRSSTGRAASARAPF